MSHVRKPCSTQEDLVGEVLNSGCYPNDFCFHGFRIAQFTVSATVLNVGQPCQNAPAAGNFAAFSPFLAAYSTLYFTMSPLAGKGTWCLLPTTPSMLLTVTKHFDRAGSITVTEKWVHVI